MGDHNEQRRPGVLVDVDGTLLDTNYLHVLAWTRALRDHGHTVTMAQVHSAVGMGASGLVEQLTGSVDESIAETYTECYTGLQDDITALPGAADLLIACHQRGLAVILATSGKQQDLDWMLPAIGVEEDILSGTATSGNVDNAKPAPDLFTYALKQFDLDPDRTVAIGDTIWDVEAATRAQLSCIALTCGGIGERELRAAGAVEVYRDPAELLKRLDKSALGRIEQDVADAADEATHLE